MARPQVQLPGIVQASPQASPTDQFVRTQPNIPVPKHIVSLSRLSQTLTGLVSQAQEDAHERSFAQGKIDGTYGIPFGSSTPDTPEMEANRKAFKAEQASGKILPSEDPWYRIGLYTGEGRRAALTMHNALMSDENLRSVSRVYDDDGNYIPFEQRENPDEIFNRQAATFLNTPALQSIYGKQAAASIVEASRAEFSAKVAHLRDQQTQMYHETQLADQTVEQLERIALAVPDQSTDGLSRSSEAVDGLHDLIAEWTVKWNLPDGPKVARQGFAAFIDKQAQVSPSAAVEAIDLIRRVKVGPTTVGNDNSEAGLEFRSDLDKLEAHYQNAAGVEAEREERMAMANKKAYLRRVEDGVSEAFASGLPPAAVYEKVKKRIRGEVMPRFQDEALKDLDDQYTEAIRPRPANPQADEELDQRLWSQPVDEIEEWIRGIAGKDVSYSQARAMRAKLQAEADAWKSLPEVKQSADAFKSETETFAADRSEGIQDKLRSLTNEQVATANQRIQLRASKLNEQQRAEQMGSIVAEEYGKATQTLKAFKDDIRVRSVAFDTELLAANNKGQDFAEKIIQARKDGLLNRSEFKAAIDSNQGASDISTYTNDERIKNIVRDLYPTAQDFNYALLGAKWNQINDAQIRATRMAEEWYINDRPKYESKGAAYNAFSKYLNENIRREIGKAMEIPGADKPISGLGTPGGPNVTQINQAEEGKAFQTVMEYGSTELLRTAVAKWYTAGKGAPDAVVEFQANFGAKNGRIQKIRAEAREELAAGLGYGAPGQEATKKTLLLAGAATARELLVGEMEVNGMKIPILPSDVDIWKTMVFQSTAQFEQACATGIGVVYDIAERYGVQSDEDFEAWVKQQDLLLKVNGL